MVERIPLGAVLVRGETLTLNTVAERITGYKRPRIQTLEGWFRTLYPLQHAEVRAEYEIDRAADFPVVSIRNLARPDGATRLIEIARAKLGADELWFLRDVTGEEASAVALRESDERFRAVTDTAPVIIYTGDLQRGCRFMNRAGLEFFGVTLEQAQGNATFERVHPDDRRRAARAHVDATRSRETLEVELRIRRADGTYRWFVGRLTPRHASSAAASDVVGVLTDITERKEAAEAFRALNERMQLALTAGQIGVWQFDVDAGTSIWDDRMLAMYGWRERRFQGRSEDVIALVHPDDRERVVAEWTASMRADTFESRFRIVRQGSNGPETVHLRSLARVVRHDDGRPAHVFGISWDVTEQSLLEEELRRAKAQADEANRAKGEFLANMSHEIRTPMNGVLGMAELALGTDLSPEQRDYVQTIQSSAESLLTVIDDILDFSKMEAGKLTLTMADFELRASLAELMKVLTVRAEQKGLRLESEVKREVPDRLHGSWDRIRQVIVNFVGNAIKFTERGHVRVVMSMSALGAEGAALHLAVEDTGVGITPAAMERIFQPFEQVDVTVNPRSGTGLGLAITAKLVEMMQGRIWVDSQPGQGSTFHATIRVALAGRKVLRESPPRGFLSLRPLSVLLAEDHFVNRRVAETILRKRGHTVVTASTGREAVERFAEARFDVVLMDVEMPDMNGIEATAAIRAMEAGRRERTPIVALTAYAMAGDGERFLAAGMDAYVTKPMDSTRLWEVIGNLVGSEV